MTSRVIDLVDLLAGLHLQGQRLAVVREQPACAFVEREGCVDQLAPVLHDVVDAVDAVGGFLPAGERHDEIALGLEVLVLLEAEHQVEPDGGLAFHVGRAAAVEKPFSSNSLNGSRCQSSRRASTTSIWPSSSTGFFVAFALQCARRCCRRQACPPGSPA